MRLLVNLLTLLLKRKIFEKERGINMNCKKCGSPLTENSQVCNVCGAVVNALDGQSGVQVQSPQPVGPQPNMMQQPINSQPDMMQQQVSPQPNMMQQPTVNPQMDFMQQQVSPQPNMMQQPTVNPQMDFMQQQPVNPQPDMMQQQINVQPPIQAKKSGGGLKFVFVGIVIVAAIFGGLYFFNSSKDKGETTTVSQNTSKSYKVKYNGFTFSFPEDYVYEEDKEEGLLLVGDEVGSWVVELSVEQGSFARIKENKNMLPTNCQSNGFTCSTVSEKSVGETEFVTMEITSNGQKALLAFAKINAMYYVVLTAMNQDNEYDYSLLNKIAPVINSAESDSSAVNSIASDFKMDYSMFNEKAQ